MKSGMAALRKSGRRVAKDWPESGRSLILVPILVPVLSTAFLSPTATAAWSWSQLPDLNRRPMLYESIALPTELNWRPVRLEPNPSLPPQQVDLRAFEQDRVHFTSSIPMPASCS